MKIFMLMLIVCNALFFGWREGWFAAAGLAPAVRAVPVVAKTAENEARPFEAAPATLVLVDELSEEAKAQGLGRVASPPAEAVAPVLAESVEAEPPPVVRLPVPWCAQVGDFAENAQASSLVEQVLGLGGRANVESVTVPISSTYWVHLPAFATQAAANKVLSELKAKKIDSFYIKSGSMRGGISLGVFSRIASARVAQAGFEKKGYATEIGEVERMGERFRVSVAVPDRAQLRDEGWVELRSSLGDMKIEENVCEIIAPAGQFP